MSSRLGLTQTTAPRWRLIGPGLVVAATGVGAADLVATLVAGSKYGYLLLWCAVVGCVMKIVLVEGAGRYSLATGRTIFEGWRSLGIWTHVVLRALHRRSGASCTAPPRWPAPGSRSTPCSRGSRVTWWGILSGPGRPRPGVERPLRPVREGAQPSWSALMFVTMVGAAAVTLPNLPELLNGLVPRIPDGGSGQRARPRRRRRRHDHAGGVRLLAAREGLDHPALHAGDAHRQQRRLPRHRAVRGRDADRRRRAAVLRRTSPSSTGDKGMLDLSNVLADRYGTWMGKLFLVGFWAAAMSSLVGVWNGVSLMFADFMGNVTGKDSDDPDSRAGGKLVQGLHPVADLPADGDDVPRRAGLADPGVRRPRARSSCRSSRSPCSGC